MLLCDIIPKPDGPPNNGFEPSDLSFDFCNERLNHVLATKRFDVSVVSRPFLDREKGIFANIDKKPDTLPGSLNNQVVQNDTPELDNIVRVVRWHYSKAITFHNEGKTISPGDFRIHSLISPNNEVAIDNRYLAAFNYHWLLFLYFASLRKIWRREDKNFMPNIGTWAFPSYMNAVGVLIALVSISVGIGLVVYGFNIPPGAAQETQQIAATIVRDLQALYLVISALLAVLVLVLLQLSIRGWLQLVYGCRTVKAYFFQFLPFRMIYLIDMYGDLLIENDKGEESWFSDEATKGSHREPPVYPGPYYAGVAIAKDWKNSQLSKF